MYIFNHTTRSFWTGSFHGKRKKKKKKKKKERKKERWFRRNRGNLELSKRDEIATCFFARSSNEISPCLPAVSVSRHFSLFFSPWARRSIVSFPRFFPLFPLLPPKGPLSLLRSIVSFDGDALIKHELKKREREKKDEEGREERERESSGEKGEKEGRRTQRSHGFLIVSARGRGVFVKELAFQRTISIKA